MLAIWSWTCLSGAAAASAARHTGDSQAAAALYARAARLRPDSWIPVYNQACLAAVEGDPPQALSLLQGLAGKSFPRLDLLARDPDLTAVRRLPGYPSLLARLKAENAGQGEEEED